MEKKNLTSAIGWVSMVLDCSSVANTIIGVVLLVIGFIFTSTLASVSGVFALTFALINFIVKHVIRGYLAS